MNEIKCPKCGTVFQISESDYEGILKQVRDKESEMEIRRREEEYKKDKENSLRLLEMNKEKEFIDRLNKKDLEISELKNEIKLSESKKELEIEKAISEKEKKIDSLNNEIVIKNRVYELKERTIKEIY